jgi:hypothetical protein
MSEQDLTPELIFCCSDCGVDLPVASGLDPAEVTPTEALWMHELECPVLLLAQA